MKFSQNYDNQLKEKIKDYEAKLDIKENLINYERSSHEKVKQKKINNNFFFVIKI